MKTKILLFLIISLSLPFLWTGCEKEPITPDPEPPIGLTVKITPVNDTVVYVGETVEFLITTTADSISLFTNTGFTKTFVRVNDVIGSANYTFSLPVIVSGRNELYGRFFKMGYDRMTINRVVIGEPPLIELYSIPYAEEFPIPWRTSCSIKITSGGGDSLWTDLPGVNGQLNGIFPTPILDTTTTYHFKLINTISGDVVEASETIYVKDPTDEDYLCKTGPWNKKIMEFLFEPDGQWELQTIWPIMLNDLIYFYLTPSRICVYDDGEGGSYPGPWYLEYVEDHMVISLTENDPYAHTVMFINQDTLVWIYETRDIEGNIVWVRETFAHP